MVPAAFSVWQDPQLPVLTVEVLFEAARIAAAVYGDLRREACELA